LPILRNEKQNDHLRGSSSRENYGSAREVKCMIN
jgi:hypothetical protein